jgi:hypothetical protein
VPHTPSAIERAAEQVDNQLTAHLDSIVTRAARTFAVPDQPFRNLIAKMLEGKSANQWRKTLGVQPDPDQEGEDER